MMRHSLLRWWRRATPSPRNLVGAVVLSVLSALASIVLLGGSGLLVAKAAGGGGLPALGGLLVLIELVAFLRSPLRLRERLSAHRVALASMVQWRTWLFDTLALRAPVGTTFLSTGDVLDRTIEDVDALQDLTVRIALPVLTTVVTGSVAIVVVALVLPLAAVPLFTVLCLGSVVAIALGRHIARHEAEGVAARGEVAGRSVDLVLGMADLMMAGAVDEATKSLEDAEERRRRVTVQRDNFRGIGIAAISILGGLGVLATAVLAEHAHHTSHLTTGEVAAVVLVAIAGTEPLVGLLAAAFRTPEVASSAARLDWIEAIPIPVVDAVHPVAVPPAPLSLRLRGAQAAAHPDGPLILKDIDLDVPPGSSIAILGSSGAGKSTLCRILLRFIELDRGLYSLNQIDASQVSGDVLRHRIAMLDQSPSLFGGTLRDCLRLGNPDASDEMLIDVLRRCELDDLLEGRAALDQSIAEDGATLSGGQQRRLALARTLLRSPDVLVLDEPTAGLDDAQAASVLASCREAAGTASVVLVTHELSLTQGFDQVLWLEEGRLSSISEEQRRALL